MDMLVILNELTAEMPIDDARELLIRFAKKELIEHGMHESIMEISKLLDITKSTMQETKVTKNLLEYKRRKESASILNKKRWRQLRDSVEIDQALDGILNMLQERVRSERAAVRKRADVQKIETIIKELRSDDHILKNRAMRFQIEKVNEELRNKEKEIQLDKIAKDLHDIFWKNSNAKSWCK